MNELIENLKAIRKDVDWENCDNLVDGHIIASFDIIQIVGMIKSEYDIKVPVSEIKPSNFNSAKALYEMIERLED
jgi:D-alanine--poly(phosphoribitol) ligase subunit 2